MAYRNGILMKVAWAAAVLLFGGALLLWPGGSDAQEQEGGRGPRGKLSTPQAELLSWSMPLYPYCVTPLFGSVTCFRRWHPRIP